MSKPSHIAYVVNKVTKNGKEQSFWHAVGAVWPHSKGGGFDLVTYDQVSVSGRIVCTVPKDDEADNADTE